jgi:antitoxin CptB
MSENLRLRIKRLKYRSMHRGTKELDLLLGAFAAAHLDRFSAAEIDNFEALLAADERDIYLWLTGQAPVPARHDTAVMARILNFEFAKTLS